MGYNDKYQNKNSGGNPKGGYGGKNEVEQSDYIAGKKNKEDYVAEADKVMKYKLAESKLTTSKIRNILAMFSEIYNEVMFDSESNELTEDSVSKINYMRVRLAYECGRDSDVKNFNKASNLIENIKSIGKNREQFILVFHYMEALVAYHRFYGGRDN